MGNGEVGFSKLSGSMQTLVLFLTALGFIVPAVLGFVNLDKRQDFLEEKTDTHIVKDEFKWDESAKEDKDIRAKLHAVELQQATIDAHYQEIMRTLAEMKKSLDNLERVD